MRVFLLHSADKPSEKTVIGDISRAGDNVSDEGENLYQEERRRN
jgi:hypothetical protein